MPELLLMAALGFLGSFGHCVSMCGPLSVAFALTAENPHPAPEPEPPPQRTSSSDATAHVLTRPAIAQHQSSSAHAHHIRFHLLLNLGRLLSYVLVGAVLGLVGSMVVAGGNLVGVGSGLRRGIALFTGFLLIWFGLRQTCPGLLPRLPLLSPMAQEKLHHGLERLMQQVSKGDRPWMPAALGMAWGLMPCGFLFAAQIKAAGESDPLTGALMMGAFGLGTLPSMVGIGITTSMLSGDRRSQLFRAGGWVAIAVGILTLVRTGDLMVDYTGYGALACLMLALMARPISRLWAAPLRYRRVLGVGAFVLSTAHVIHRIEHTWSWNIDAIFFMPVQYQQGIVLGAIALLLLLPLALTSFDRVQKQLGHHWRRLHLLSIPALILTAIHCILVGSSFLGRIQLTGWNYAWVAVLTGSVLAVLAVRQPWAWALFSAKEHYAKPSVAIASQSSDVS